ncbi:hypothetical protein CEUSTIGMA_g7749.t1 [Chlamydomonas eustigma]|uniref:Ammonium transporter AmtB-like domain-containing protein n=1 Tax=Chlamydomonas eustigma TaxID=1157962 RepID=A0A250XB50_9CHLO|nr:hypothetical protein CEUSTIGMA_g7749.t1 [Chlamydomonas eustigma]|eukprot:GAX80311.1 hypothetical protein CEUSTIGMA_g7749.t1 [Chlamydomonas eustigma]
MNSETHKESLPTTSLYSDRPHQPAVQVPPSSKEGSRAGTDFKNKVKESSHHHEAHVTIALDKHHYHISVQSNYQSSIFTPVREGQLCTSFSSGVLVLSCLYIGLLLGLTQFASFGDDLQAQVNQYYQFLLDVNIMVFVGFGFLMTFLRRYCLSAVALNMEASAIVYVEAILVIGAMQQVAFGGKASSIIVDMPLLINAAFCAASCMIAFGAVIGKTTPGQLVMLLVAQVPIYAANQHLAVETFKALDMGGTIVIHLFGAYYGLAASYMLSRNQGAHGVDHPKNVSGYLNDAIAMVGDFIPVDLLAQLQWGSGLHLSPRVTTLPWSITDAQASSQFLCIVNTLLSLLGFESLM